MLICCLSLSLESETSPQTSQGKLSESGVLCFFAICKRNRFSVTYTMSHRVQGYFTCPCSAIWCFLFEDSFLNSFVQNLHLYVGSGGFVSSCMVFVC
jgi:hypothetical protein